MREGELRDIAVGSYRSRRTKKAVLGRERQRERERERERVSERKR